MISLEKTGNPNGDLNGILVGKFMILYCKRNSENKFVGFWKYAIIKDTLKSFLITFDFPIEKEDIRLLEWLSKCEIMEMDEFWESQMNAHCVMEIPFKTYWKPLKIY